MYCRVLSSNYTVMGQPKLKKQTNRLHVVSQYVFPSIQIEHILTIKLGTKMTIVFRKDIFFL